jgi:hypothetical protein
MGMTISYGGSIYNFVQTENSCNGCDLSEIGETKEMGDALHLDHIFCIECMRRFPSNGPGAPTVGQFIKA